ncbi:MAG: hypothetical protein ACRDZ4_19005 [Egibacteraceae bacterium]
MGLVPGGALPLVTGELAFLLLQPGQLLLQPDPLTLKVGQVGARGWPTMTPGR